MAVAVAKSVIEKKERIIVEDVSVVKEIILSLNIEEAEFLLRLLGHHILGRGKLRKTSDNIFYAIRQCHNVPTEYLDIQKTSLFLTE
jgi:hypothetical protein